MTRTIALALLLASAPIWAEDGPKPKPPETVKVYQVKPSNAQNIHNALCRISICGVTTQGDLLMVRMPAELATAVDALVPRLDSTPVDTRNVELTFYILQVSREPLPDSGAIPQDLEPTVKQLRSVLGFQGAQLLDTGLVRTRNQERFSISLQSMRGQASWSYSIRGVLSSISDTRPPSMRLDDLDVAGFRASVDIKEGQKAVIGKTSSGMGKDSFVLVVSGKVVD